MMNAIIKILEGIEKLRGKRFYSVQIYSGICFIIGTSEWFLWSSCAIFTCTFFWNAWQEWEDW